MKRLILSIIAVVTVVFTSCSDDDVQEVIIPVTPDTPEVTAPPTYKFERGGESTVSFSGQTTRIKMAEEIIDALKNPTDFNDITKLNNMFNHQAGVNDFSEADLNASSKSVRSKTAASADYFSGTAEAVSIKEVFDGYMSKQVSEVFPNWEVDAVEGTAGKIQEVGGSTRYVNAKGLEYNQAFNKGLIGALMVDQMLNNYLSPAVLDGGTNKEDNDAGTLAQDKNYTTMEHKWDEAYGYLYGNEVNPEVPVLGADSFLNKYLKRVNDDTDFSGIKEEIYDAFKLGRAAIVAKDYELRDTQANIIKEAISKVIAIRAVYYLQTGKNNLTTDLASAFHDLSEGYGFVYALRFTRNTTTQQPHLPVAEITEFVNALQAGTGFYSFKDDASPLDEMSTRIASVYGFTVDQAK
ncbi:DUF4856 domain-containing protein [Tenacibaculum sp. C7A-26P2]|uniref:DUF4856 domain-containing protein n=1 Tax=Tenacibaculum sp. C7A-26P2 TaxID=3447504 RepID=UPI003F8559B8